MHESDEGVSLMRAARMLSYWKYYVSINEDSISGAKLSSVTKRHDLMNGLCFRTQAIDVLYFEQRCLSFLNFHLIVGDGMEVSR